MIDHRLTLFEKITLAETCRDERRIILEHEAGWSTVTPLPLDERRLEQSRDDLRAAVALIYDVVAADADWWRWASGSYNGTRHLRSRVA